MVFVALIAEIEKVEEGQANFRIPRSLKESVLRPRPRLSGQGNSVWLTREECKMSRQERRAADRHAARGARQTPNLPMRINAPAPPAPPAPPRGSTPSAASPLGRVIGVNDEQNVPTIPSPLNPAAATSRAKSAVPAREQRDKKDSLKKREAKGTDTPQSAKSDSQSSGRKTKKGAEKAPEKDVVISPFKYPTIEPPRGTDFEPPNAPTLTAILERAKRVFYESSEHPSNRKGYRYVPSIADPSFALSQFYRQTETEPYGARMSFEDTAFESNVLFSSDAKSITNDKGWRMSRANVVAREGKWYYEVKIVNGQLPPPAKNDDNTAHVRIGWARREAALEAAPGFDAYGYGLRDVKGEKIHRSRPQDFFPQGENIYQGDVIGLEVDLPSIQLHRKVVEGSYNKAVDVSNLVGNQGLDTSNIVRDRVPIRFKGQLYFESFEYAPTKELEDYANPAPVFAAPTMTSTAKPNPNHASVSLRTLPFSSIKVFKNGKLMGEAFKDLLAFLPPASKPMAQPNAREGLDDGMLGYFPAVSVFGGGAAETNFGPHFWFPPPAHAAENEARSTTNGKLSNGHHTEALETVRPMSARYAEQIGEDVLCDIVDEAEIYGLAGGTTGTEVGGVDMGSASLGAVAARSQATTNGTGAGLVGGEIQDIVQDV